MNKRKKIKKKKNALNGKDHKNYQNSHCPNTRLITRSYCRRPLANIKHLKISWHMYKWL
jgi:hypothetical protein